MALAEVPELCRSQVLSCELGMKQAEKVGNLKLSYYCSDNGINSTSTLPNFHHCLHTDV